PHARRAAGRPAPRALHGRAVGPRRAPRGRGLSRRALGGARGAPADAARVGRRTGRLRRRQSARPIVATGASSGCPDPSRFDSVSGILLTAPFASSAYAGSGPAHASCRRSSPFRNACARTPPVARPFDGNSPKSLIFARPASVPSSVLAEPEIVTTTLPSPERAPKK